MRLITLFCTCLLMLSSGIAHTQETTKILWPELIPEGWDPYALYQEYSNEEYNQLSVDELYALEEKAQEMIDKAPVVATLDDKQVKVPGFVLPLEFEGTAISEFLLVPYLGACIHYPPPPANQIIRGSSPQTFQLDDISRPVWITGRLKVDHIANRLGEEGYSLYTDVPSAYSINVEAIEPYREKQ